MGDHIGRDGNGAAPLTERLQTLATSRRPDDEALPGFLQAYYRELPDFDVDDPHFPLILTVRAERRAAGPST